MDRTETETQTSSALPAHPYDPVRAIGTAYRVDSTHVRMHLFGAPGDESAARGTPVVAPCQVGDFVVFDCGDVAVFGRLTSVELPEDGGAKTHDAGPTASALLLTSMSLATGEVTPGVLTYPRLGSTVYAAHPLLLKWIAEESVRDGGDGHPLILDLATLPDGTHIGLTPERLFGRHCALLGTTGGGKSYTLARIIEACSAYSAKLVLLDPTGEYHRLDSRVRHISVGGPDRPATAVEAIFPYRELVEEDMIALFEPDSAVQLARMRSAIKSLKLANVLGLGHQLVSGNGCIPKAHQLKAAFDEEFKRHIDVVDSHAASFDLELLPNQIRLECVWPSAGSAQTPGERARWGGPHEGDLNACDALIARIEAHINAPEYHTIFQTSGSYDTVPREILEFLESDDTVLRISLRQLSYTASIREIVANAIGRHLLELGKSGAFAGKPVVVLVDEAHQFVSRELGDETWRYSLDAFELIAKEGRKYSVTVCLATQRPRDIPEGVMSQVGTFVVHRLISDADRAVVERASGEIDRAAADFLPTLAPGQAVVIGVDFPMPLMIQIRKPTREPDAEGPDYQTHWR